jgi:hypothetical protein
LTGFSGLFLLLSMAGSERRAKALGIDTESGA